MKVYKEVNWMFLFCSLLVIGGEINRAIEAHRNSNDTTAPSTAADQKPVIQSSPCSSSLIFPVPNKSRQHLIGKFGDPRGKNGSRRHEGIDIAAERGTPVVAVSPGKVTKVKEGGNGGKQVWMEDQQRDWTYYYAHLDRQDVKVGQSVEAGDQLGTVGSTGNAPKHAPHLHFCIYKPGMRAFDPLTVLP